MLYLEKHYDVADRMVLGQNLEIGEESGYVYNALGRRIKNTGKRNGILTETEDTADDIGGVWNDLMQYGTGGAATLVMNDIPKLLRSGNGESGDTRSRTGAGVLTGTAFYGIDKAVGAVSGSIAGNRNKKETELFLPDLNSYFG